jgi:hypothetical protein
VAIPTNAILIVLIGYFISVVLGTLLIQPIVGWYWKRYFTEHTLLPFLSASIGTIERFMYTSAYLLGAKEFIAVWLALKLAWQWRPDQDEKSRTMFYILLIGNALSIIFGVSGALVIQVFLR